MSDTATHALGVTVAPSPTEDLETGDAVCGICERFAGIYEVVRNSEPGDPLRSCARHLSQAVQRVAGFWWQR